MKERGKDRGPPTQAMESWRGKTPEEQRALQLKGWVAMAFGFGLPLVGGLFVQLAIPYYLFGGAVGIVGVFFTWPEAGYALATLLPAGIAKLLPSRFLERIPERRSEDEEG